MLRYYIGPLLAAVTLFPVIAALFTLPFVIRNYRKFGGIAVMRVVVVYSFILYCMCAFLLTVMPLPSVEAVAAMETHKIGWIPFYDIVTGMQKAGFSLKNLAGFQDRETWKRFIDGGDLFQYLANIAMTVPLGFYLRYYFRLSLKKTVILSFCVSLFFEITQLTGLFFIYPKAYRFTQVDDLAANTLGGMLGYAITPAIGLLLPSREEIDRISYLKGEHVSPVHSFFAIVLDVIITWLLLGGLGLMLRQKGMKILGIGIAAVLFVYYLLLPPLLRGSTLGQAILKIRTVKADGRSRATVWQLIWRNFLLYGVELTVLLLCFSVLGVSAVIWPAAYLTLWLRILLTAGSLVLSASAVLLVIRSRKRSDIPPHSRYSHTTVVPVKAGTRRGRVKKA